MSDLLKGLNPAQLEAVTSTEGFVRVIAGAGSGKTRVLSRRFAYLVNEIGIMPGNILCVTFTNKSAQEMRQRIHRLTGDNDTGRISTFHGFCVSVLQEDSHAVQYPRSFLVLDNADIDAMLGIIYEERGLSLRDMTYKKARDMIEIRKTIREPEYYQDIITMSLDTLGQKYRGAVDPADIIFYGYLYQQKKCFGLDYNDLIKFTLFIFERDAAIRLKWQKRLEYIMIDEFQDIDALQYRLMEVLCGHHKNLFIVGDPDQTIYSWRGADVRYLLDFDEQFPSVKTIMMMENYRSSPEILAVANSLIDKNENRIKKELLPKRPGGSPVVCHHGETAEAEAAWIAGRISSLREEGVALRDITLLYRAHYLTRSIEAVFLREKIPYVMYSGIPFYGRKEIKDALSYLRLLAYRDDLSFLRVANEPKRNIGKRRMQFLQEVAEDCGCSLYQALVQSADHAVMKGAKAAQLISVVESFSSAQDGLPVSEVLAAVLDRSGYEEMLRTEGNQERLDNLAELKQSVHEYETSCGEESTLEHYLSHVALFSNSDAQDGGDRVKLMTVHAAKGLEFSYVFLCGLSEGVFPSKRTSTLQAMEEERRLAFVAMTRAEKGLFLTESEGRNADGSDRYPSRFVLDIDPELLRFTAQPKDGLIVEARQHIAHTMRCFAEIARGPEFSVGQRVEHSIFGAGAIAGVDEAGASYVVQFDGMDTTRAISFRARLEPEKQCVS